MAVIAIAALVVAGVATAVSVDQQRAAARDAKRARKAQRRAEQLRAAQARKKTLAAARRQRALALNRQGASGVTTSSTTGQVGSIQSQLAANISFLNNLDALSQKAFIAQQNQADHLTNAGTADAVASTAFTVASLAGGGR